MTPFYASHFLYDPSYKDRYGNKGNIVPPSFEEVKKLIKQVNIPYYDHYFSGKNKEITVDNIKTEVNLRCEGTQAIVSFCAYKGASKYITLCSVTLSTIDSNCGSILISNLRSDFRGTRLATTLFEQILKYCELAGYSYLLLNTAGGYQNTFGKHYFQKRYGFNPVGNPYVNKRSRNVNIWYEKHLLGVQKVQLDEAIDYQEEENDEEDYDD